MRTDEAGDFLSQFEEGKMTRMEAEARNTIANEMLDKKKETAKAKKLIDRILYFTLSTANKFGVPWGAPFMFAHDKDYNFYWRASRKTVHSVNIIENENVAFTIYDSTLPRSEAFGVYVKAKAYVVDNKNEIKRALKMLLKRENKQPPPFEEYLPGAPKAVYKAVPTAVWVNDLGEKGDDVLKYLRMEIKL